MSTDQMISLDELKGFAHSPGHVYYVSERLQKRFPLLKAGDPIDSDFLAKYSQRKVSHLLVENKINKNLFAALENKFLQLKNSTAGPGQDQVARSLIEIMDEHFLSPGSEGRLLDLFMIGVETFLRIPQKYLIQMRETSLVLYKRSLILGGFSIVLALRAGYRDFYFLQDLFQAACCMDLSLFMEPFDFYTLQACERERLRPGRGVEVFREPPRQISFRMHPLRTYDLIQDQLADCFHTPKVLAAIKHHHEYNALQGFPRGLASDWLEDFELILMGLDQLIPYSDLSFYEHVFAFIQFFQGEMGEENYRSHHLQYFLKGEAP